MCSKLLSNTCSSTTIQLIKECLQRKIFLKNCEKPQATRRKSKHKKSIIQKCREQAESKKSALFKNWNKSRSELTKLQKLKNKFRKDRSIFSVSLIKACTYKRSTKRFKQKKYEQNHTMLKFSVETCDTELYIFARYNSKVLPKKAIQSQAVSHMYLGSCLVISEDKKKA